MRKTVRALRHAGAGPPALRPDLRSSAFGNYVIFFRERDEGLEVVNIPEGHRDIDALFSGSAPPEG